MLQVKYREFTTLLFELYQLKSVFALLDWDTQVNMPEKGSQRRGETVAYLAGLLHHKFVSREFENLLKSVRKLNQEGKLDEKQSAVVREVYREFTREKKLPENFVRELAQVTSQAHQVWTRARKENKFHSFLPYLERIIDLKRREAEYVGYRQSPYDALLDTYEPGAKATEIDIIFTDLKEFLVPFLKKIQKTKSPSKTRLASGGKIQIKSLKGNFLLEKQKEWGRMVARALGFDFTAGRIDQAVHPFATNFHPEDVRITTRFNLHDLFYSLMSTIHEVGHALYEQGLPAENFGTPLAESISLGIHESQSRVWENQVGRSLPFWKYFYPALQRKFPKPFGKIKLEDFYRALNSVRPSLIRTESDEVTYNLHIVLRFELEKELIEGKLDARDAPEVWNQKMKEYFGLVPKTDREGILQDVHWSAGLFGYFPTYALGNLYSAQFYAAAKHSNPGLESQFARGKFAKFRAWLKTNIHIHGRFYSASQLCKKITGKPLNTKYFTDYLTLKYSQIYKLSD